MRGISKRLAIPIDVLAIERQGATISDRRLKPHQHLLAVRPAEQEISWFEESPKICKGDDTVAQEVVAGRDGLVKLAGEDSVQQLGMLTSVVVLDLLDGFLESGPAIKEGGKWLGEDDLLQCCRDTFVAFKNLFEKRLQERTLNHDRIDIHRLSSTSVILPVANDESKLLNGLGLLWVGHDVCGVFLNPIDAAGTFFLALPEVLNITRHADAWKFIFGVLPALGEVGNCIQALVIL